MNRWDHRKPPGCQLRRTERRGSVKTGKEIHTDVAVLTVAEPLMWRPDVELFLGIIRGLVQDGLVKVVLDLSEVKVLPSAMLGAIAVSQRTLWDAGGEMRLAGGTKRVERTLGVTRLDDVFRSLETVDRAIESFRHEPPMQLAALA